MNLSVEKNLQSFMRRISLIGLIVFVMLFLPGCGKKKSAPTPISSEVTPTPSDIQSTPDSFLTPVPTGSEKDLCECNDCPYTVSFFIQDNLIQISSDCQEILTLGADIKALLQDLYQDLDSEEESSQFFRMNNTHESSVTLSALQKAFIQLGLTYTERCNGAFDLTDEPLRELWRVDAEDFTIPTEEQVSEALLRCDSRGLLLSDNILYYSDPATMLNTDSYLNGFCIDYLAAFLRSHDIKHAHITIGNSVVCIEPDDCAKTVSLNVPSGEETVTIGTLQCQNLAVAALHVNDCSLLLDGTLCHPIWDIHTGYPSAMGFSSVFVISPSAAVAEIIVKACYSCSFEEGNTMLSEIADTYAIYRMDDGSIRCTDGLTDHLNVTLVNP